jgi:MoaA/NifB/PqqE/SkfB family radical SAM enzyme
MSDQNKFCPLPWIHLATRPNGDVRVCCTANASGSSIEDTKDAGLVIQNGSIMNLRDHTIEDVWNSQYMKSIRLKMLNNEIPSSCTKCFDEESRGIKSKRNWETIVWNQRVNIADIVSQTSSNGSLPVHIPYFDLRLGKLCNLKCIMCSPHDSSAWIKDWKLQYPKYKINELKQDQHWDDRNRDYTWYQKGVFLDTMKSQAQYIKELYFAGGEPLLIPEHYSILEFMISEGHAKNCILRYNSNGTEISEKLLSLWDHFKLVKFNFSIDALKDKNNYIRYPSQWNSIVNNLEKLDNTPNNVIVNIACAVQLLNVLYLDELVEWKVNQKFKKINSVEYGAGLIGLHLVYFPNYMNIRVLPDNLKDEAARRIYNLVDRYSNENFDKDPYGKQRWLGLINYMKSEDWSSKFPQTIEYLEVCDQTRKTDFKKTFLDLGNL